MGLLDHLSLPTLASESERTFGKPLPKGASRLQRKMADDKDEKKAEAEFRAAVWTRDQGKCRLTKRKCKRSLELDPLRGEVHHIVSRTDKAVRYDRRNGILLSAETHERVTRHELRIEGTSFFTVRGKRYINADMHVRFVKVTA